ncbi:Uncharacterised protein [uncultured Eubacterium sp.]|uniref:hypothetical protein n=1 Tax=Brotomerdimonas butyrica TaxID=2981721 RepID=UPI0008205C65|nr:hypothetical protein [Brotomerdimonas butyrica]MCU6756424.1 hypothetical protein [Brotomerdimonas butyrica]SCH83064.1 Uncharacterised protein [uncultured Eubacterium sp.]
MNTYRVEIEDDNFEIILANSDDEALSEMWKLEEYGHSVFNLFRLDDDYNEIETIF